jgi:hypothetical protein
MTNIVELYPAPKLTTKRSDWKEFPRDRRECMPNMFELVGNYFQELYKRAPEELKAKPTLAEFKEGFHDYTVSHGLALLGGESDKCIKQMGRQIETWPRSYSRTAT